MSMEVAVRHQPVAVTVGSYQWQFLLSTIAVYITEKN